MGFLGHLPGASGISSWGTGGSGASIETDIPIGFWFHDIVDIPTGGLVITSCGVSTCCAPTIRTTVPSLLWWIWNGPL